MTDEQTAEAMRVSPLDAEHRALGARMVPFGGWEMPIQYTSVLEEHRTCRDAAVVFDVSHLGSVEVRGPAGFDALQWALTNDLHRIGPGRAQYTHLLDPVDAHVMDDIIVWWLTEDRFLVMPNASNTAPIVAALEEAVERADDGAGATTVEDITATRVVLAVQGPTAREQLATFWPEAAAVERFTVRPLEHAGVTCVVAGTGYTGEDGVELQVPVAAATTVWREILAAGIVPAGLGARDTLRLESGLPLHGHELGEGITSLQAGLGWVVRWDKGDFRGRAPLAAEKERGVSRKLTGLVVDGRQIPRAGCPVLDGDRVIGEVTSGNFSPALNQGIALAFLDPTVEAGTPVTIDIRGRAAGAVVTRPPFRPA